MYQTQSLIIISSLRLPQAAGHTSWLSFRSVASRRKKTKKKNKEVTFCVNYWKEPTSLSRPGSESHNVTLIRRGNGLAGDADIIQGVGQEITQSYVLLGSVTDHLERKRKLIVLSTSYHNNIWLLLTISPLDIQLRVLRNVLIWQKCIFSLWRTWSVNDLIVFCWWTVFQKKDNNFKLICQNYLLKVIKIIITKYI